MGGAHGVWEIGQIQCRACPHLLQGGTPGGGDLGIRGVTYHHVVTLDLRHFVFVLKVTNTEEFEKPNRNYILNHITEAMRLP